MRSRYTFRQANIRLIPCALILIAGVALANLYGNLRGHNFDRRLIAAIGVFAFVVFATLFMQVFSKWVHSVILSRRLGVGRAASIQFMLRLFGYIAIILAAMDLLDIPVGRLLLGGAVLGIILGVAAQQALANFFASIMLTVSHPLTVGEEVTITSGALGGVIEGKIIDIGLTHTHLVKKDGQLVLLPNATLLSAATISPSSRATPARPIEPSE